MEYGSEFDLRSNEAFRGETVFPADCQLFRSGRDALKAFARLAGKRRVLLPALCCESMILPFRQNGWEIGFYRLRADYSADEADVLAKLGDGSVLLYMRYFGIRAFTDDFLETLRGSGRGLLFLEDRTHDLLVPRVAGGFQPDAVVASLRKWAALPEGGVLQTGLGTVAASTDSRYGELRLAAMEEKSRFLENGDMELRAAYTEKLRRAESLLDASAEPAAMHPRFRQIAEGLDYAAILAARRRNIRRLRDRLAPLLSDGTLRLLTPEPEKSGLYLPVLLRERAGVLQELYRRRLYCPQTIWPEPAAAADICPVCHFVTEHILALLCDQRYHETEIDYLADSLTEILHKDGKTE